MSCGVGQRRGLELGLLWPAAIAQIGPLAWELPYALGASLKKKKKILDPTKESARIWSI